MHHTPTTSAEIILNAELETALLTTYRGRWLKLDRSCGRFRPVRGSRVVTQGQVRALAAGGLVNDRTVQGRRIARLTDTGRALAATLETVRAARLNERA